MLVVDDDADIAEALCELLEVDGYEPIFARNGKEGLAALDAGPRPCLVLLDIMMPVMDGYQFLEGMRARSEEEPLPVVVLSASAGMERVQAQKGVSAFLKKPFSSETLLRLVQEHCGPSSAPPSVA